MSSVSGSTPNVLVAERKYQIFISSTFQDLALQRRIVLDAVINRGHMPIALERYSAFDRTVSTVIQTAVVHSQIYISILGHRYGELVGLHKSYCEYEFDLAEKQPMVILPFMLDDREVESSRAQMREELTKLTATAAELKRGSASRKTLVKQIDWIKAELANEEALWAFRKRVRKHGYCRVFHRDDDTFSGDVMKAIEDAERDAHARSIRGWVKEPETTELAETLHALSGNQFLVDTVKEIGKFERLGPRVAAHADEKQAAATCFADRYQNSIIRKVDLFFESGSSIAYVAKELGKNIGTDFAAGRPDVLLSTNNVLAYMNLWLTCRIPCSLFPWGPPEDHYGAIFGCLDNLREPIPQFPPEPLSPPMREAITTLTEGQYSPAKWGLKGYRGRPALLIGALSGLQLSNQCSTNPANADIRCCMGPHVGSFKNKLFKRFMYGTGLPLMIFMTADKIDNVIEAGRCHFVLDEEFTWDSFRQDIPVAFCVGCMSFEVRKCADRFREHQFDVIENANRGTYTAFIARNKRFIEEFEKVIGL